LKITDQTIRGNTQAHQRIFTKHNFKLSSQVLKTHSKIGLPCRWEMTSIS
jgi:hypothetical protein